MQVISAILNAHLKNVEGREALTKLQRETEIAVRTRSDLDTPAGARDFQRFLIGKLRDISAVVLNASLDDTSKSALMAAWTSLYGASKSEPNVPGEHPPGPATGVGADGTARPPTDGPDTGWDPRPDSLLADDPGLLAGNSLGPGPTEGAQGSADADGAGDANDPQLRHGAATGSGHSARIDGRLECAGWVAASRAGEGGAGSSTDASSTKKGCWNPKTRIRAPTGQTTTKMTGTTKTMRMGQPISPNRTGGSDNSNPARR